MTRTQDLGFQKTENIENVTSRDIFKLKMKEFYFNDCPCDLCKDYVSGVGYVN